MHGKHVRKPVQANLPSGNSSNRTLKAPSMGAQDTSSMGRTVSPSVASKKVAPFAFSLHWQNVKMTPTDSHPHPDLIGEATIYAQVEAGDMLQGCVLSVLDPFRTLCGCLFLFLCSELQKYKIKQNSPCPAWPGNCVANAETCSSHQPT